MRTLDFLVAGIFAAIILAVVLFGVLGNAGGAAADLSLSLSDFSRAPQAQAPEPEPDRSRLRFAIAAVLSPSAMLADYQALADYLGTSLGRQVEVVLGKSYAEINAMVRSGDVSLALVCSGAYVVGHSDFGMELLVVPVVDGKTTYRSYLIVPAGSSARGWNDLRGGRFAFSDPLSNSGRLVPVYVLANMGESPDRFFEDFIFTYSHDRSVQAVAEGLVDAASVDSLVYDRMAAQDPAIAEKTKIIWSSPPYGINPVVVHPGVDPDLRRDLEETFLRMSDDPKGQAVLSLLGIDTFALPDRAAYATIEQMIRTTRAR